MKMIILTIMSISLLYSCKKGENSNQSLANYLTGTHNAYGERWYRTENCNCYLNVSQVHKTDSFILIINQQNDTTIKIEAISKSNSAPPFVMENIKLRKINGFVEFYGFERGNGFYSNTHSYGNYELASSRLSSSFDLSFRNPDPSCLTTCGFPTYDSSAAMQNINMIDISAYIKK